MSRVIRAAGALVLREHDGRRELAVVHRPEYGDWTLPKGKLRGAEVPQQTAVRETAREIGLDVALGLPMGQVDYKAKAREKTVHFWLASAPSDAALSPGDGIDEALWVDAKKAAKLLSHPQERDVAQRAFAARTTTAVVFVRHGKAVGRSEWREDDILRPLNERGHDQARWLASFLAATYRPAAVHTSPATRCAQTITPFARAARVAIQDVPLWTEEAGKGHLKDVTASVRRLAKGSAEAEPLVLCGHRPLLPAMLKGVGVVTSPLGAGDLVVAHVRPSGRAEAVEVLANPR